MAAKSVIGMALVAALASSALPATAADIIVISEFNSSLVQLYDAWGGEAEIVRAKSLKDLLGKRAVPQANTGLYRVDVPGKTYYLSGEDFNPRVLSCPSFPKREDTQSASSQSHDPCIQ